MLRRAWSWWWESRALLSAPTRLLLDALGVLAVTQLVVAVLGLH